MSFLQMPRTNAVRTRDTILVGVLVIRHRHAKIGEWYLEKKGTAFKYAFLGANVTSLT